MIVLDTNVISEMLRPEPDPAVVAWLSEQDASEVFLTAITAAELRYGVALLPLGKRREILSNVVDGVLEEDFAGQILPFGEDCAAEYASIAAGRRSSGQPISDLDCQIAAICRFTSAILATRNIKDFTGCEVALVDPWRAAALD